MIFDRFLGVEPDAYTADFCRGTIAWFDLMERQGFTRPGCAMRAPLDIYQAFNGPFWETHYKTYIAEYGILQSAHAQAGATVAIRKIPAGAPQQTWRGPTDDRAWSKHLLEWVVFLNEIEAGGELELIHQRLRVPTRPGALLIWPAAFTHAHHWCTPRSEDQYVLRGWVEHT